MNIDIKQYDQPEIIEPTTQHKYSIIWLHGLGADGNDFVNIVPMLGVGELGIKFIFPHAKVQSVTINGGMAMRSWYDITTDDFAKRGDEAGINESVAYISKLIENEAKFGIKPENIILAGFSQGGAIALQTACNFPAKLAGVIAMSCYLPLKDKVTAKKNELEIFMAHGTEDPIVPFIEGKKSFEHLKALGFDIQFKDYNMQHAVSEQEIIDIGDFIQSLYV